MPRSPRHAGLILTAVVLVSALARFAAARSFRAPWVAPDEMAYGLLGQSLWQTGELAIRGTATGYYSLLYPAFVGGPLSIGDLASGIVVLQAVQALAMSAAAVPVFLWGRRLMGDRWALVAAVLSILPPALAYSGLIMSESLYYPVVVGALMALAFAVREPTLFRLGVMLAAVTLAASVRLQALVLLPAFLSALVLDALLARDRHALRRYAVGAAGVAAIAVVGIAAWLASGRSISSDALLGAYVAVAADRPGVTDVARELVWSSGGLVILSLGIPLLGTALLTVRAFVVGERNPTVRAFLATTTAYVVWLVLQVSFFAATFVTYVPERYLITAAPLLYLGLCVWLARGAYRRTRVLVPVAAAALIAVASIPPRGLFVAVGTHDLLTSLTFAPFADGAPDAVVRLLVIGAAVAAVACVALVPASRAWSLVVVLAVGLMALSVGSSRQIAQHTRAEETKAFGTAARTWIDDAAGGGHVALLDTGDREWPIVPRTAFWNDSVVTLLRFPEAQGTGAIPQTIVAADHDGILRTADGSTVSERLVVAPVTARLAGEKLAEIPPTPVAAGLALWRVSPPARLESTITGINPNGDFAHDIQVTVYACRPGRLELTLLGKSGAPIELRVNRIPRGVIAPAPDTVWRGSIAAPPNADGSSVCVFELSTSGLAGSTQITFTRG